MSLSTTNSHDDNAEMYATLNESGFKVYHDAFADKHLLVEENPGTPHGKLKESTLKKIIEESKRNSLIRNQSDKNNFDLVSIKKSSLNDLLLETGVYISATKQPIDSSKQTNKTPGGETNNKNVLSIGDRILSINGISLTNKTLYEIMELVNQCKNFNLVIQKVTSVKNPIVFNSLTNSSSSFSLNPIKLQANKEYFVVSQTISNISAASNQKLAKPHRNPQVTASPVSSSSQALRKEMSKPHAASLIQRPDYNIDKQFQTRNRSTDSHHRYNREFHDDIYLQAVNNSTLCSHDDSPQATEMRSSSKKDLDKENLVRYQDLVKNFHQQSRKENQIMSVKCQRVEAYSKSSLSSSAANRAEADESPKEPDSFNSKRTKKIIISDLMQYNYRPNVNGSSSNKRAEPPEELIIHKSPKNNTALWSIGRGVF